MEDNAKRSYIQIHNDHSIQDSLVIKKYAKYLFSLIGFALGSIISILIAVFEDHKIDLDIFSFYSDFYHLVIPVLLGLTGTLIGFLQGKKQDKKKIEQYELSLSQQTLSLIFDNLPVLISFLDTDLCYRFANKTHENWMGLSLGEIYGKSIKDVVGEQAFEKIDFNIRKAAEGNIVSFESIREMKGTEHYLNSTIIPYKDETQKINGYFSIVADITELKIRENKIIEQNFELAALNATKDKFFSIIAHDLKNPFSSLLGFTEILYNDYDSYDENTRKKFIKAIHESSENTYQLLENLLVWSRTQSVKIEFNPTVVNIKALVEENLVLLKQFALAKNIQLESIIQQDLFINTDRNLINTIVRNLLTNALKFTPEKGKVIVSERIVSDDFHNEFIEVSIQDTGIGISQGNIRKLFKIDNKCSLLK